MELLTVIIGFFAIVGLAVVMAFILSGLSIAWGFLMELIGSKKGL